MESVPATTSGMGAAPYIRGSGSDPDSDSDLFVMLSPFSISRITPFALAFPSPLLFSQAMQKRRRWRNLESIHELSTVHLHNRRKKPYATTKVSEKAAVCSRCNAVYFSEQVPDVS